MFRIKQKKNYKLKIADCCNPLPKDKITSLILNDTEIIVHKTDCTHISKQESKNMIPITWVKNKIKCSLSTIKLKGRNRIGLVNNIINLISKNLNINMRSIYLETYDDIFSGQIELYVQNSINMKVLIKDLLTITGIKTVTRVDDV